MKVVIVAFNYGYAGKYVNGPGICLSNFHKILKNKNIECDIFTELKSKSPEVCSLSQYGLYLNKIKQADLVMHWSGINHLSTKAIKDANKLKKDVYLGPNLIDTVELEKEKIFLNQIKFKKIITVNERLRFLIAKQHNLPLNFLDILMIGPDLKLWKPIETKYKDETILWKGNSSQFVKDVKFALELEKFLPEYKFKFIGYPTPYEYNGHIEKAKKSKICIITSLSETMGMSQLESYASGLPSVIHPKIYLHGINYKTGIITNKNLNDYAEAIREIMTDKTLYNELSVGCLNFVQENFSEEKVFNKFMDIIK